jgi:hypothetical protein
MPSILPKLPKDFPFHGMRVVRGGYRGDALFRRHDRSPKTWLRSHDQFAHAFNRRTHIH